MLPKDNPSGDKPNCGNIDPNDAGVESEGVLMDVYEQPEVIPIEETAPLHVDTSTIQVEFDNLGYAPKAFFDESGDISSDKSLDLNMDALTLENLQDTGDAVAAETASDTFIDESALNVDNPTILIVFDNQGDAPTGASKESWDNSNDESPDLNVDTPTIQVLLDRRGDAPTGGLEESMDTSSDKSPVLQMSGASSALKISYDNLEGAPTVAFDESGNTSIDESSVLQISGACSALKITYDNSGDTPNILVEELREISVDESLFPSENTATQNFVFNSGDFPTIVIENAGVFPPLVIENPLALSELLIEALENVTIVQASFRKREDIAASEAEFDGTGNNYEFLVEVQGNITVMETACDNGDDTAAPNAAVDGSGAGTMPGIEEPEDNTTNETAYVVTEEPRDATNEQTLFLEEVSTALKNLLENSRDNPEIEVDESDDIPIEQATVNYPATTDANGYLPLPTPPAESMYDLLHEYFNRPRAQTPEALPMRSISTRNNGRSFPFQDLESAFPLQDPARRFERPPPYTRSCSSYSIADYWKDTNSKISCAGLIVVIVIILIVFQLYVHFTKSV